PAGTYRLTGLVKEAGIALGIGIAGARVEIISGVGAGTARDTDLTGGYRLYGLSGETKLRVTKEGYNPIEQTLVVENHQAYDVELPLLEPNADVSGTYTLTIIAADECAVGLGEGHVPEEAR